MKIQRRKSVKASNKPAPRKRAIKASISSLADKFYDEIHSKLDGFCAEILRTYYEPLGITEESPAIEETIAYDDAIDNMTNAIVNFLNVQIEDMSDGEIEESVRTVKASNEVYRNTDQNAFPVFIGNVEDALEVATEGAEGIYDIQGTRFVSDDVVDYELIVRDRYDRPQEIGYITIEQSPNGFRAWRGDDEETEFVSGNSFDDILDACVENCAILIEDYENGIQDSPSA